MKCTLEYDFYSDNKVLALHFLDMLSDESRLDVFNRYCINCGSKNPECQCGNDD